MAIGAAGRAEDERSPTVQPPPIIDGAAGVRGRLSLLLSHPVVRRGMCCLVAAASMGYVSWLTVSVNLVAWWVSVPFLAANLGLVLLLMVSLVNNWSRSPLRTAAAPSPDGQEPVVGVLVPTWNEPEWMVARTLRSVLEQHWPTDRMVTVVGDDGRRAEIRALVDRLAAEFPVARIYYHLPPVKGGPSRRGDGKAGNLNALLEFVLRQHPEATFIETRDADDLVGDPSFLRRTTALLVAESDVAYVQTAKDAVVSAGDPFGNRRTFFYRGIMLSRDAGGAAFPCGSGLVWRLETLVAIGGFSAWNLVEDLYSGYLALGRGYRGRFLPVRGALAQSAPEDVPNVYQQLGTWALDTLRIFFWRAPWRFPGLRWRQRLHFLEMGLFYLSALPTLVLIVVPALCLLFDVRALRVDPWAHAVISVAYTSLVTAFTFVLGNGTPWREMVRAKQIWVGMSFRYARACWLALRNGPDRKPPYLATRKVRQPGLYLSQVAPQLGALALMAGSVAYHLWNRLAVSRLPGLSTVDIGSIFWVLFYAGVLGAFVRKSWYGAASPFATKCSAATGPS
jgi:cellulose synthase (UDP-forming)